MSTYAKVIADAISPAEQRLTVMEVELHRFVLAELNTHRSHSRSSASSRAIPVEKQLFRVVDDPAWPLAWTSEKPGMQGGEPLTGQDLEEAQALFTAVHDYTTMAVRQYLITHPDKATRLHKSLVNRLLEPFMWHKVIFAATDLGWENFFSLRSTHFTPLAQPEFAAAADRIFEAREESTPVEVGIGEWVTPYIRDDDDFTGFMRPLDTRLQVSVGRCARVSYLTHDGERDLDEDIRLFTKLVTERPPHSAPLEFVATPAMPEEGHQGNFDGWHQLRHLYRPDFNATAFSQWRKEHQQS